MGSSHAYLLIRPRSSQLCALLIVMSNLKLDKRKPRKLATGQLWSDEDFAWCKMDSYCTGSIIVQIKTGPVHVFRAWEECWEKTQFNKKGDSRHAARVSAKYGGLNYYDSDNPDHMGVLPEHDSVLLTKCTKATMCTRCIVGKGWIYTILGVYAGFDPELKLECQVDCMYDK